MPAHEQLLVSQGRLLVDCCSLSESGIGNHSTVHLLLRLCGGKGGFGALLRGQGRDGKITDNFDAMRDLSGRRVRHVEAEKKLKEWQADAKERELEKVAMQHMKEMAKQAKRQQNHEVNSLRTASPSSAACSWSWACGVVCKVFHFLYTLVWSGHTCFIGYSQLNNTSTL